MRQVNVNSLKIGDVLGKNIYSSSGRVLLGQGVRFTSYYIAKLKELGISIIYIEDERFADVEINDVITEQQRRAALQVIDKSTQAVRLGKEVNGIAMQKVIHDIVKHILFQENILVNMMDIRSKDNQLFAHSVNVCVLAVVLGKALGYDEEKLHTLATGALLHDIGMVRLDPVLFNKTENLTTEEMAMVKEHTTLGFEELRKRKDLSLVVAHIAFQHHEHVNGTGYPRQLKEKDIHPLAQIVAMVDLYDKLTSDHSGLKRVRPHDACEILMGLAGKVFALEMVRLFLRNIAVYPTGVTVKLNTGEIGVVVGQNLSMPGRPIVRVFAEMEIGQVCEYDMIHQRTVFITEVLT